MNTTILELLGEHVGEAVMSGRIAAGLLNQTTVDVIHTNHTIMALIADGHIVAIPKQGVASCWHPDRGGMSWGQLKALHSNTAVAQPRQRSMHLTDAEWKTAKRYGDGNATEGVRRALRLMADSSG